MKLYYSPGACSLSPHIVAREAGIPIELEKVASRSTKRKAAGLPDGKSERIYSGVKLEDGSILTEGPAIIQYLADQKPASGLAPSAGTIDRYRLQEWLTFIGTEIHKSFTPLFNPTSFRQC